VKIMEGQAVTETAKASIPAGADTGGDSKNMEESNSSALNESRFSGSNPVNPESRFSVAEDEAKVSESADAPAKAIVEKYHSCRKEWLFQNPSGALSVAAKHGKDWERWMNDCFMETKSKTNQATCLKYYNVEGIDEGFTRRADLKTRLVGHGSARQCHMTAGEPWKHSAHYEHFERQTNRKPCQDLETGDDALAPSQDLCVYCQKRVSASKDRQLRIAHALEKQEKVTQAKEYHNNNSQLVTHGYYTVLIEDDASLIPESLWRPP
jgi:hypothetical protein